MPTGEYQTRYSLFEKALKKQDQDAWTAILTQYRNFILFLLNEFGVNESDREDLAQQISLTITQNLDQYDQDKGRFRSWLRGIIKNEVAGFYRKYSAQKQKIERFTNYKETQGQSEDLDAIIDQEWENFITQKAFERVSEYYTESAIKVFELSLEGMDANEIAQKLDIAINSVYSFKNRVKRSLFLEVRALIKELEG